MPDARSKPQIPTTGRVLGVDLGEVRTGLATTDLGQVIASAHETLDEGPTSDDAWAEHIDTAARAVDAVGVVIGLPISLDGRDGPPAQRARRIGVLVAGHGWVVEHVDERFTTTEAERVMIKAGTRRKARRQAVDRVAAAVLLQQWVDTRNNAAARGQRGTR